MMHEYIVLINLKPYISYNFIPAVDFFLDHLRLDSYSVDHKRPGGRVVMRRTANPYTSVRFRSRPPTNDAKKQHPPDFTPLQLIFLI